MIIYPKAKINLGLRVVERRKDGFHNLETLFVSLPTLTDILEITESDKLSFSLYGIKLQGEPGTNLCERAFSLLASDFNIKGAEINLVKRIPFGAGLGGGSSDGAATLLLLNKIYKLGLSTAQLMEYAAKLGSDLPFFVLANQQEMCSAAGYCAAIGKGRGELLSLYQTSFLNDIKIKVISPNINISTAEAYSWVRAATPKLPLERVLELPVENWREELINDFEEPLFLRYPQLEAEKERLYKEGALFAALSGSGSSLFGLFRD